MTGEAFIVGTIRLSLLLYVVATWCRWQPAESISNHIARWLWAAGAILLVAHTLIAFHYAHHWSHAHAYNATAQGTAAVIGIHWGGGLYVNYLFTLTWLIDAAWSLILPATYAQRTAVYQTLLHSFLAFIIINATIVFHSGWIRWAGLTCGLLLFALCPREKTGPIALHTSRTEETR